MKKNVLLATIFLSVSLVMAGCGASTSDSAVNSNTGSAVVQSADSSESEKESSQVTSDTTVSESDAYMSSGTTTASSSTLLDTSSMFTERDLEQEADLSDATTIELKSGEDVTISSEGVYVITGNVTDCTIIVEATDAKVQLVLDGVTITNTDAPAIYVKEANKVFVTTTDSENTLTVTGSFTTDGETNTDAVIFSKDDIVLNGVGTLTIKSSDNGISGKDDLKITGGTYNITAEADAIEANDSIRVYDGTINISGKKDGLHSENDEDTTVGYIYIYGGTLNIDVDGDGIQATTVLMIDGGTIDIDAVEALEATYIQINDGNITLSASDDGINASAKSSSYTPTIEINGGNLSITMGSGDTDALDSNGNLYINGGTIDITAQFAFDFDGEGQLNGGTVTVNGEEVTEITNSMFGGGGQGGFGGGQGGMKGGFGGGQGGMRGGFRGNGNTTGTNGTNDQSQTPPSGEMPDGATPPSGEMPDGSTPPSGEMPQGGPNGQKGTTTQS